MAVIRNMKTTETSPIEIHNSTGNVITFIREVELRREFRIITGRKAREVPSVRVEAKHNKGCRFAGRGKKISCGCPKILRYYQNGDHRKTLPGIVDKDLVEAGRLALQNELAC